LQPQQTLTKQEEITPEGQPSLSWVYPSTLLQENDATQTFMSLSLHSVIGNDATRNAVKLKGQWDKNCAHIESQELSNNKKVNRSVNPSLEQSSNYQKNFRVIGGPSLSPSHVEYNMLPIGESRALFDRKSSSTFEALNIC